jgi:hypothetical protein
VQKDYSYLKDRVFQASTLLYGVNRWLIKPHTHQWFFNGYFNDLLLIPCALPCILWLHRQMNIRSHDRPPKWREILFHLTVWSILFEIVGPQIMRHTTGDPLDIAAYVAGGLCAGLIWNA